MGIQNKVKNGCMNVTVIDRRYANVDWKGRWGWWDMRKWISRDASRVMHVYGTITSGVAGERCWIAIGGLRKDPHQSWHSCN